LNYNTLLALAYESGIVKNVLPAAHPAHLKVNALIKLCGLDKFPGNPEPGRKPSDADMRWKFRLDTMGMATRSRPRLETNDTVSMREQIVENAQSHGGFGIWFEVFKNDADMRLRLIAAFPGTATDCFDNGSPIPKPGSEL
jgi:hypothetical protein